MAVRKLTTGKWLCECYPAGRSGRRVRKQFATKGEALAFERHTMEETEAKPWLGESVDRRTLKDVVELWFKLHGKSLTAGQHVYDKLLLMVDALGNPLATDLTSKMLEGIFYGSTKTHHREMALRMLPRRTKWASCA